VKCWISWPHREAGELQTACNALGDGVTPAEFRSAGRSELAFVATLDDATCAPFAAKQGWTDVARLGEFGVRAINCGPGETARAHRPDESIDLGALDAVRDGLRRALAS
jgi:succinyl-diaminopimelate desuccinylase